MELHLVKDKIQREVEGLWVKNNFKGLAALCTGAGKSKIFINIVVNYPKEKWLLIVPTEKLRDENWSEEFKKWKQAKRFSKIDRACYASLNKLDISKYDGICLCCVVINLVGKGGFLHNHFYQASAYKMVFVRMFPHQRCICNRQGMPYLV